MFLVFVTALLQVFIFADPHGREACCYCRAAAFDHAGGVLYLAQNFPGGLPCLYPRAVLPLFALALFLLLAAQARRSRSFPSHA